MIVQYALEMNTHVERNTCIEFEMQNAKTSTPSRKVRHSGNGAVQS